MRRSAYKVCSIFSLRPWNKAEPLEAEFGFFVHAAAQAQQSTATREVGPARRFLPRQPTHSVPSCIGLMASKSYDAASTTCKALAGGEVGSLGDAADGGQLRRLQAAQLAPGFSPGSQQRHRRLRQAATLREHRHGHPTSACRNDASRSGGQGPYRLLHPHHSVGAHATAASRI
jgi:hypothetical protein